MRTCVIALAVGIVLAACSPTYHDATLRYPNPGHHTSIGLFQIIEDVNTKCTRGVDRVVVVVERPEARVRLGCDEITRTRGYAAQEALVHAVRDQNDALTATGRYLALHEQYPRHTGDDFDYLLWGFASDEVPSLTCERTRHVREITDDIEHVKDETPVQWTLVEGVRVAAECPDRLQDLYATVAKAGYPQAAREARVQMAEIATKAGVTLPASAIEPA